MPLRRCPDNRSWEAGVPHRLQLLDLPSKRGDLGSLSGGLCGTPWPSGEHNSIHLGTTHNPHHALQGLRLRHALGTARRHSRPKDGHQCTQLRTRCHRRRAGAQIRWRRDLGVRRLSYSSREMMAETLCQERPTFRQVADSAYVLRAEQADPARRRKPWRPSSEIAQSLA